MEAVACLCDDLRMSALRLTLVMAGVVLGYLAYQAQVDNLFGVARDHGRTPRLQHVAIGAQGPVAEAALARHGLEATFRPAHGHMGALVLAAAEFLSNAKFPQGVHAK